MIELISKVFATRGYAHVAHWGTKSYAEHMALGDFYEDIIDGIDKLVEAYQGTFGLLKGISLTTDEQPEDICKHIAAELIWMNNSCEEITKDLPALDNILQELQAVYMKVLYKLKNLS